jgi:hypothetical protein
VEEKVGDRLDDCIYEGFIIDLNAPAIEVSGQRDHYRYELLQLLLCMCARLQQLREV